MRVRLLKQSTIENYAANNPHSRDSLLVWLDNIKEADWNIPIDILQKFPSADLLGNGSNRVVFDVTGNRYRLICRFVFGITKVHLLVCWIGTHTQYTRLCNDRRQYTIHNF